MKKPHSVVNFLRPHSKRVTRNFVDLVLMGTQFFELPIPFVGSIVRILYKEIFIREIQRQQMSEAGFKGNLNHDPEAFRAALREEGLDESEIADKEQYVFEGIQEALVNPIEFTRQEEMEQRLSVESWISKRDSQYTPFIRHAHEGQ